MTTPGGAVPASWPVITRVRSDPAVALLTRIDYVGPGYVAHISAADTSVDVQLRWWSFDATYPSSYTVYPDPREYLRGSTTVGPAVIWDVPMTADEFGLGPWAFQIIVDGTTVYSTGGSHWQGDETIEYGGAMSTVPDYSGSMSFLFRFDLDPAFVNDEPSDASNSNTTNPCIRIPYNDPTFDFFGNPIANDDSNRSVLLIWVDWGDGTRDALSGTGDEFFFDTLPHTMTDGVDRSLNDGTAVLAAVHTYAVPGSYTVQLWGGGYETGLTPNPPTFDDTVVKTMLAETTYVAAVPPAPVRTQRVTKFVTYVVDISHEWPQDPSPDGPPFGNDWMILCGDMATWRTHTVARDLKLTGATFHNPIHPMDYDSDQSFEGSDFIGVDQDLTLFEFGRASGMTEARWQHGDGPTPTWARNFPRFGTDLLGGSEGGVFYFRDYIPSLGVIGYSFFAEGFPGANFMDIQVVRAFNPATGADVADVCSSPLLPDQENETGRSAIVPAAWRLYDDNHIVWVSNSGNIWVVNIHNQLVRWLVGSMPATQYDGYELFFGQDFGEGFNSRALRDEIQYGRDQITLSNVREDGSITLLPRGSPVDLETGGRTYTYAVTIDRSGHVISPLRQLVDIHSGGERLVVPDDFELNSVFNWADSTDEGGVVADPVINSVYFVVEGRLPDNVDVGGADAPIIYRVDLNTGTWHRVANLAHPYLYWNFNPATFRPVPPQFLGEEPKQYDRRTLEMAGQEFWVADIPVGTYKLRHPPYPPLTGAQDDHGIRYD